MYFVFLYKLAILPKSTGWASTYDKSQFHSEEEEEEEFINYALIRSNVKREFQNIISKALKYAAVLRRGE